MKTKQCGWTCKRVLPLAHFPRNSSRPDGRHCYCLDCSRAKTIAFRKQVAAEEKDLGRKISIWKPTPRERVVNAIRAGARTQAAIRLKAKVQSDELGDLLAELIIERGEVRTVRLGEVRQYFAA